MKRGVFKTKGVCSPEIHFAVDGEVLREVNFMGGGCPGQAELVSRLLPGHGVDEVLELTEGIVCRNDTSCPAQLAEALVKMRRGELAEPLPVLRLEGPVGSVAVIAHVDGRPQVLHQALEKAGSLGAECVILLGDAVSPDRSPDDNRVVLDMIEERDVKVLRGEQDQLMAQGAGDMDPADRQRLRDLPVLVDFMVGEHRAAGFYGGYLMELPGFSEAGLYSLEIITVCQLSLYLEDQAVIPAVETMAGEMAAQAVLFAHTRKWNRADLGGRQFFNIGPVRDDLPDGGQSARVCLLEAGEKHIAASFS